jgi:hypothetical protein
LDKFDEKVKVKLARGDNSVPDIPEDILRYMEADAEVDEPVEPDAQRNDADDYDPEVYDKYILAQVLLPKGDSMVQAQVIGQKKDRDGNPIGKANRNPLMDTRIYDLKFPDGHTEEYHANLIAESLYS